MPIPDFLPNGAPAPKPNLPYAEPNIPNARPTGLPPGMSPLPKTEPPPGNVPTPKPSGPGQPITKPLPKPDFGGKTAKPLREFPKTNTPRTPGPKPFVPTIPQLIRKVIEYVLEPQPTSDGTAPDYEETRPEDEPYPDTHTEPELETQECLDAIKYPQLAGRNNDSLVQITYYVTPGHQQTYNYNFRQPPSKVIGRKTYVTSERIDPSGSESGFTVEYKLLGKRTFKREGFRSTVIYKVGVRDGRRRVGDGLFLWNGWTVLETGSLFLDVYPSFPSPIASRADLLTTLLYQGTNYFTRFPVFAYPCSPEAEPEIQDPNEYDREKDDKEMACKWQPANDPHVASLETETLEYKKFVGCVYRIDGTPDFYSREYMQVPKCLVEPMTRMLENQYEALTKFCEIPDPILVVPDWMPLKWANVEKLVVMYAEKVGDKYKSAKYQVTIPHWGKDVIDTRNHGFTPILKGQHQLIHELKDSSRITLNCATGTECNAKMLEFIRGLAPAYQNVIKTNPVIRGGVVLAQIQIHPVSARFFKAGTDEIKPEWTVKLV